MGIYNEAHRIVDCLEYHLPFVDEAAIVIQESDDGTEQVVEKYLSDLGYTKNHHAVAGLPESDYFVMSGKPSVSVLHFPKMGSSEATLQDGANALQTEWILYVDADEKFPKEFLGKMRKKLDTQRFDAVRFQRDNYFKVKIFNEAVPIEPKFMMIKHPARDEQVRLYRKIYSVFPRQIHVRARVRRPETGQESITTVEDAIYHLKDIEEQWLDNRQYIPDVRIVDAMEVTKRGGLIDFPTIQTGINWLSVAEFEKNVPFPIKRVFWITNPRDVRGNHANRKTHEVLICIKGSMTVILDNTQKRFEFKLDSQNKGLFVKNKTWIVMRDFEPGTVILCLASETYDPSERMDNYDQFVKEVTS